MAVYFVGKILLINLIKNVLEIEVVSIVAKNSSSLFDRGLSDFFVVGGNKISKQGRCFPVPAINKTGQRTQNLCVCLEEHVMQPDSVATFREANVDHGMDVIGNSKVDGSFHQPEEGLFKV